MRNLSATRATASEFLRDPHHCFPRSIARTARFDLDLIDRPVHRGFDTRGGPTFFTFSNQHALQPRDHRVDGIVGINSRPFVRFNRTIDVDHFLAVRPPPEHLIKERAVPLTLEDEIDQRRDERDRHKCKIAHVIEQHLELEHENVAKKFPALVAAGFDGKRIGRAHGAILNRVRERGKFRVWAALPSFVRAYLKGIHRDVSPFRHPTFTIRNLTRAAPWIIGCS